MQDTVNTISKLLNLASDAAASEAEVTMALKRADALMRANNLTEADIRKQAVSSGKTDIVEADWTSPTKKLPHAIQQVAGGVAAFTETNGVIAQAEQTKVRFIGRPKDAALAVYLLDLIQNSAEAEFKAAQDSLFLPGMSSNDKFAMKNSFQYAMGIRMRQRLNAILAQRNAEKGNTALVVSKREDIAEYITEKYGTPKKNGSRGPRKLNRSAVYAGMAAADKVNITTGIGN